MLRAVRDFFDERNYFEVETPLLSSDVVVDAYIEPVETIQPLDSPRRFLQTSPEAGMKRLLAAGSGSIYQITRSFRRDEFGDLHNSEFTMLEWYGVDTTWLEQIELTEELIKCVHNCAKAARVEGVEAVPLPASCFQKRSYESAFSRLTKHSVLDMPDESLHRLVNQMAPEVTDHQNCTRDDLLNILLAECIEPQLGSPLPEYLHSYPISQAALAEQNKEDSRTASRFELYWGGLEICNGYQELTDAGELVRRDQLQNDARTSHQSTSLPGAPKLQQAMQNGLPECSGVALGFDRLVMAIFGLRDIKKVIPFPDDIA